MDITDEVIEKIAAAADDEEEAFRAGYLAKLAGCGVSPELVEEAIVDSDDMSKSAGIMDWLGTAFLGGKSISTMKDLGTKGIVLAAGLPIGLGALAGWGLSSMGKPTNQDVKLMENEALADTYDYHRRRLLGENKLYQRKRKQMEREGGRSMGLV